MLRASVVYLLPSSCLCLHHKLIIHILHAGNHGSATAWTRIPSSEYKRLNSLFPYATDHPLPSPSRGLP